MSTPIPQDLDGKVAIVTGALRGIGFETAKRLAQGGARVIAADLASDDFDASVSQLQQYGEVLGKSTDIGDEASVRELMKFTIDNCGRLDAIDNNAAVTGGGDGDVLSMDVDVWDRTFAVNARGTMLMCKHGIAAMIDNGGGSIINISSGTSMAGQLYTTAYACTKGAINTLTKYVATQYGSKGIRCNALALGLVMTERLAESMPEAFQQLYTDNKLVGRLGKPSDVAEMVAFLASDRSAWITGEVYGVNGGFFAHGPTLDSELKMLAAMGGNILNDQ